MADALLTVNNVETFYGPITDEHYKELKDASLVEKIPVVILIAVMIIVGFYPYPVIKTIDSSVVPIVQTLHPAKDAK